MQENIRIFCVFKVIASIKNTERIIYNLVFYVNQPAQHLIISPVTQA